MKQAEHPPVTAGANSAAEYSLAIIDQLARIDRTCSKGEMDELVYRLLAFVGGHLGSARENLCMLTLLEEKQKSLEQNLQAVKLEQQMLKALCKDSTSVYRVDLMNDRAEIVKIEDERVERREIFFLSEREKLVYLADYEFVIEARPIA